jgi:photosystem II stability/assembly factor-like uncharacterized protein
MKTYLRFVLTLCCVGCFFPSLIHSQAIWQPVKGPYSQQEAVRWLGVQPSGNLLAATWGPGSYDPYRLRLSSDDGSNWTEIRRAPFNMSGTQYSLGPAAFDSTGRILAVMGPYLLASASSGNTWDTLKLTSSAWIDCVCVNPRGELFVGIDRQIRRSTDGGASWTQVYLDPDQNVQVVSFAVLPDGRMYASTKGNGVLRSSDFGATWTASSASYAKDFNAVALLPDGSLGAASDGYGFFISTDSARSWTASNTGVSDGWITSIAVASGYRVLTTGRSGDIFRSTNNGKTWENTSPSGGNPGAAVAAVKRSGTICIGTRNLGVFLSSDGGSHWYQKGFSASSVTSLGIDGSGILFAGSSSALFRSIDAGSKWELSLQDASLTNAFAFDSSGRVFAGTSQGVLRSLDAGLTWTNVLNAQVSALALTPSGDVLAGGSGVLYSASHGDPFTWRNLGPGGYGTIHSIAAIGGGVILAGSGEGIHRSSDGGATWRQVIFVGGVVGSIAKCSSGTLLAGTDLGIFRSTDQGESWTRSTSGASSTSVQMIVSNRSGVVFAGSINPAKLFRSLDDGKSWATLTLDGGVNKLYGIARSPKDVLYAGTDVGLFVLPDNVVAVSQEREKSLSATMLEQNYPNPFNPATTIRFSLATASSVELVVYDLLGRRIKVLVNESLQPGPHAVTWDSSGLASGIYFYCLQAGEYVETKKMILLR